MKKLRLSQTEIIYAGKQVETEIPIILQGEESSGFEL